MPTPTQQRCLALPLAALLAVLADAALAQTPRFVASYRDWALFVLDRDRGKICYVASEPAKQEGNYTKRGTPAVVVALWSGDLPVEQVSVQPGYSYRKGSTVELAVGTQRFDLFTQGDRAWARSDGDDKALIGAMRRGSSMTVKGTSARDTNSTDTYSLAGFANAYEAMRDACKSQ